MELLRNTTIYQYFKLFLFHYICTDFPKEYLFDEEKILPNVADEGKPLKKN